MGKIAIKSLMAAIALFVTVTCPSWAASVFLPLIDAAFAAIAPELLAEIDLNPWMVYLNIANAWAPVQEWIACAAAFCVSMVAWLTYKFSMKILPFVE